MCEEKGFPKEMEDAAREGQGKWGIYYILVGLVGYGEESEKGRSV